MLLEVGKNHCSNSYIFHNGYEFMTQLTFLGTGEAFDPEKYNSSCLIEHGGK
jgi:hypothetical protein